MKNKTDLGKYDLNKLLRNPGLIHKIQDNLLALKHDSLFAEALIMGAKDTPKKCVQMIIDQYPNDPKLILEIVGKDTLKLIEEYECISLSDDLKNVLDGIPDIDKNIID